MLTETLSVLRSLPRPFRILLAGVVLNRLATFILPFLSLVLVRDHGFTAAGAGLVILAYGSGSAASMLFGGLLTDALGRRPTLLCSLFGGGALAVTLGFVDSTAPFVALLLLYGFVADLFRPAVSSIIADLLPPAQRATGFAALRTAVNVGWAAGLSLGGFLADLGPRILFVGDGITTLAFGVVVLAGVPETRPAAAAPPVTPGALLRALAGDGVLRRTLACSLAWALFIVSFMTVFPLTVTEGAGLPPLVFGFTMGLNGLLVALLQIPSVRALEGRRRLRAAAAGMLLGGAAIAAVPLLPRWEWYLLVMTVYTAGELLVIPQVLAFLSDWAPPERRGTYLALQQATFSVMFAVSPVALLPLRQSLGDGAYWPLLLLAALPAAWILRDLDRTADLPGRLAGAA